jgi:hypothetical protein
MGCKVLIGNTAGAHRKAMETIHYRTSKKTATVASNVVVIDLYRTDPYGRQERGRDWGMERTLAEQYGMF